MILPRPYGEHLRILVGTGGNPASSARAGAMGLPIVYAIIGGEPERFAPLVELYRRSSRSYGNDESTQHVTMTGISLLGDNSQATKDGFFPYWLQVMKYGAEARGWTVPSRADYDRYTDGARDLLVGTPEEIAERIITVGKLTKADRYGLQFDWAGVPHASVMKAIELFGTQIRPLVEKEIPRALIA